MGVIALARVYDTDDGNEGPRFLVERLWPRGLTAAPEPVVSLASCQPVS